MGSLVFAYAALSIAFLEVKTVYILDKAGSAYAMNIRLPFCVFLLLEYAWPWVHEAYRAGGGILLIGSFWMAEILLLTVVLCIVFKKIERYLLQSRKNNNYKE